MIHTVYASCNPAMGLLLCTTFLGVNMKCYYYIFNPTNKQFSTLPDPNGTDFRRVRGLDSVSSIHLAFDPSNSPYYKVVCIYRPNKLSEDYAMEIYSSETNLWKPYDNPFPANCNFGQAVFCNGAIHWLGDDPLYFKVDEERFGELPLPIAPEGWEERRLLYFGESRNHLHFIEVYYPPKTRFNVYESERDYSGWFVKYRVDLEPLMKAFPGSMCEDLHALDWKYYRFNILSLVRKEQDTGDSLLVVSIPGKTIGYNIKDKIFRVLREFAKYQLDIHPPMFSSAIPFIASLYCV